MAFNPSQTAVARRIAAAAPGSRFDPLLVATAIVESNLTPTAAGDGGRSHGVFQEYDLGRGAGIPVSGRRDVGAATSRAYREFSSMAGRYSGAELAYRAQRPADRAGYLRKIQAALPLAQQLLGARGGARAAGAPQRVREAAGGAPSPGGGGGQVTPESLQMIREYAARTRQQVLAGQMPESSEGVLRQLRFTGAAPAEAPGAGHDGHDHGAAPGGGGSGGFTFGPTGWKPGGGPEAHGTRALGNWQSDNAYDVMGKAGDPVFAYTSGVVTKISGQPGGDPGFAGYGITVRTPKGDLFYKHLGTARVRVGDRINPRTLLGTLDAKTAGGPHLHLGAQNRGFLDNLYRQMLGR